MRKLKKISFVLIGLMALFLLAACGDSSSKPTDGGSDVKEKVEITWLVQSSGVRDEWYDQMIEEFEEENDHITVELMTIPQDEIDRRVATMFASNDGPDVWSPNWSSSGFGAFHKRDVLLDLTEYVEKDADFLDGIPDELMDAYTVDGKSYGIPMLNMGFFVFYNKDMFDEAGIEYPPSDWDDSSWDWDALVDKAKKMTKNFDNPNEANYGFYIQDRPLETTWMFGGDLFSEEAYETGEMGEPQASKNPKNKEAYQALYDLMYKHKVAPNAAQQDSLSQIGDPFLSGKVAMAVNGGWGIMTYLPAEFRWGFAPVPYIGSERPKTTMFVDPWTIGKDSEHPDEAWEFIKFITDPSSDGGGYKQMVDLNNPPVYDHLLEEYYETIASHENIDMTVEEIKEAVEGATKYGRPAANHLIDNYSNIGNVVKQTTQSILNDNVSIEEGLEEMDKKLKSLD